MAAIHYFGLQNEIIKLSSERKPVDLCTQGNSATDVGQGTTVTFSNMNKLKFTNLKVVRLFTCFYFITHPLLSSYFSWLKCF